ncbi:MAG: prenyltransferase/squalene oxidase repeat-containing protein [Phycisphaeraceae bacterium]
MPRTLRVLLVALLTAVFTVPALAIDDAHAAKARQAIDKGIAYLKTTQGEDGSWTPKIGPGVTALVLSVMLDQPNVKADDPAVQKAVKFVMGFVKDDGGIHAGFLENYNTSICLSALSRLSNQPDMPPVIKNAQDYLLKLQWTDQKDATGKAVDENHRWYGGAGYGDHGRPDMSNLQMMLQALYDSGFDCTSEEYKRALVFVTRCQGTSANKELGDKIVQDGGFIYATSTSKEQFDEPESKGGMEPGTNRLATYGSMTYAGFKSYLYAKLERDDVRVQDAVKWIKHNFVLDRNPGMPEQHKLQGLYYYYMTMARALRAWGETTITTADGKKHDWQNELIDQVVSLQREDGSWVNEADRWMEGDPSIVTAYSLIALTEAAK